MGSERYQSVLLHPADDNRSSGLQRHMIKKLDSTTHRFRFSQNGWSKMIGAANWQLILDLQALLS